MWQARIAGIFLSTSVLAASPAFAFQIFTVGGDGACGFTSIQAAVDAAAAAPGEDYIWIARNRTYTAQHIVVQNQSVLIEGGFDDCSDFTIESELTTINGAGNGGGAVFAFRGTANVLLSNLFIRGAERSSDADGGGIDYAATGDLGIQKSTISLNSAGYGAGINFRGSGGPAVLNILNDTLVLNNTAQTSGGGIRVEGNAILHMHAPNTLIAFNHALDGYGGGVEVIGPAQGSISSPGYNGGAVIQFNDAVRGGGLSINGGQSEDQDSYVRLFTSDPQQPVKISNNVASLTGGGIYLQPFAEDSILNSFHTDAKLCAFQFQMDDNIAQTGSAIFSDTDTDFSDISWGGLIHLLANTAPTALCPVIPGSPAATNCAEGIPCNTMDRNITEDTMGQPTDGATILMLEGGRLDILGLRMRDNTGGQAVHAIETYVELRNSLIANNTYSGDLLLGTENEFGYFDLNEVTIAANAIGGSVVRTSQGIYLYNMVIAQPNTPTLTPVGTPPGEFEYIVASDIRGLPNTSSIDEADPQFVDASNGNFRLAFGSPGMDFAPAAGGLDLDGNPRDVDLAGVPNVFGPRDIGAYESQLGCVAQADTIFCDGFDNE